MEKLLPLHAGGDLGEREARLVDEHLTRCLGCFRLLKDYESTLDVIHRVGQEEPPAGATDGLVESILAATHEDGPRAPSPRVLHLRDHLGIRVSAAAAAILVVLLGTSALTSSQRTVHPTGNDGSVSPGASVLTITDTDQGRWSSWPAGRGAAGPERGRELPERSSNPERRKTWFAGSRSRDF